MFAFRGLIGISLSLFFFFFFKGAGHNDIYTTLFGGRGRCVKGEGDTVCVGGGGGGAGGRQQRKGKKRVIRGNVYSLSLKQIPEPTRPY